MSDSLWLIVHGILQARILEWVAFPFSRAGLPNPGINPGLPHCRRILYQLSHKRSLRILEWVAYLFSSGSSWPRNRTRVSYIAGRFFTNWAIREAPYSYTCYTYIYKSFFTMLDKGLRKNNNNNNKKETEIGKQTEWNRNTEYEIEKVKETR